MIKLHSIVNSIFTSITYIVYEEGEDQAWIIDIGDINPVLSFLKTNGLYVRGVFLTHAHFDHIYGLKHLLNTFNNSLVYCTQYSKYALASSKLNLSEYHDAPFTYDGKNVIVVNEGDQIRVFDNIMAYLYETPGHNPGCLTIVIRDMMFTGDAYIPGVKIYTNLPFADKERARESLDRILSMSVGKRVFPGHIV